MKKLALATLGMTLLFSTLKAEANVTSRFCKSRAAESVQELLFKADNQLSFRNYGGLINGGVCWWHSRFTRNALYLAQYLPQLPRPTQQEGEKIIAAIRRGKSLVQVPGYANLNEFSRDFGREIQSSLESWQRMDGMVRQQWVVGLAGAPVVSSTKMKSLMDTLFEEVTTKKEVIYQKLQFEGIEAHAWLVLGMTKIANGYKIFVLDSNFPAYINSYEYREGMTHFTYQGGTKFVPYTGNNKELARLRQVVDNSCAGVI